MLPATTVADVFSCSKGCVVLVFIRVCVLPVWECFPSLSFSISVEPRGDANKAVDVA